METTAERIKALRRRLGLSQEMFGAACNVTKSSVCQWERGRTTPDMGTLLLLRQKYDFSVEYVLTGKLSDYQASGVTHIAKEPEPQRRPLLGQLCAIADSVNDDGLRSLIDIAHCFVKSHPANKAKPLLSA